jgi:hypothetical protein
MPIPHADEQREELLILQRALLALAKRLGVIICGLIVTGVIVGIADHYKLQNVETAIVGLKSTVSNQQDDGAAIKMWRVGVDLQLIDLRTRVTTLETQSRQ